MHLLNFEPLLSMTFKNISIYTSHDIPLLFRVSDDRVVKVADFGLSRDIFNSDYYKADRTAPLPVRWMSVESLKDTKFSVKSDVVCILYNYAKGLCTHSLFLAGSVLESVLESADCSTDSY